MVGCHWRHSYRHRFDEPPRAPRRAPRPASKKSNHSEVLTTRLTPSGGFGCGGGGGARPASWQVMRAAYMANVARAVSAVDGSGELRADAERRGREAREAAEARGGEQRSVPLWDWAAGAAASVVRKVDIDETRQTDRPTDRKTERQTERQKTDRQTDRQR